MTPRTRPCSISWLATPLLVSVGLLLAASAALAGPAGGTPESVGAANYFAFLKRLDSEDLLELKRDLREVVNVCSEDVDRPCPKGATLLQSVFSKRRPELPDLILYMSRDDKCRLHSSRPVLQWKGKNTAHLFGANSVWILVFAEEKLPLEAAIVPIYQQTANPFAGLLPVVGVGSAPSQAEATKATTKELSWATINQESPGDFYLGTARLKVGTDSVNFVTVGLKESQEQVTECEPQLGGSDPLEGASLVPANAASAHFSNSGDSFTAFSVGFAQTADVADTALGQGASGHLGAYAMAKIHVLRPRIKAFYPEDKIQRRSRLSLSFVLGTNLHDDPFEEFVAAFSVGNIMGKTGLLVGANYTPFLEKKENGVVVERFEREWKLIWGVEYTF